ncbi:MAG: OmpA family protein [Clostridia bacterium]|jgi:chemotaxis protein MotB
MPRPRRRGEQNGGSPEWMTTYADMVTLLLCFFVLLFSFSKIDAEKWRELVKSMRQIGISEEELRGDSPMPSFPTELDEDEPFPEESLEPESPEEIQKEEPDEFDELYRKIKDYIQKNGLDTEIELGQNESGILIRFKEHVLFDSGKAEIKKNALTILNDIYGVLHDSEKDIQMIRIEGHTDNVPIHTSHYPSNWELSTARAVNVLRYFIEVRDLNPLKVSAVGYGEYHPIRKNDTDENRARNRRVDLVIVRMGKTSDEK